MDKNTPHNIQYEIMAVQWNTILLCLLKAPPNLRFGQTKNVGHWGGRYIWQIKKHSDLIFCWKPTPKDDPREIEKQLLSQYIKNFGGRPFANLTG